MHYPDDSEKLKSLRQDPWRICRPLLCIMCVAVCGYQLIQFMKFYFGYETLVTVETNVVKLYPVPAFAICNRNNIRRSLFCDKYPDSCNQPITKNVEDVLTGNLTSEDRFYFSHTAASVFYNCTALDKKRMVESNEQQVCRALAKWVFDGDYNCFAVPFDGNSLIPDLQSFSIAINFEHDEYLNLGKPAGARMYVLSDSQHIVNRRLPYFTIQSGFNYNVHFSRTTIKRLEPPYKTACKDYGSGNEENCYTECVWRENRAKCGCIPSTVGFLPGMRICNSPQSTECRKYSQGILAKCEDQCPSSCSSDMVDVKRGDPVDWVYKGDNLQKYVNAGHSVVSIDLRNVMNSTYFNSPKFEGIEVFSYIGGYLGIWLGLSIPAIFEELDNFRRIMTLHFAAKYFHN